MKRAIVAVSLAAFACGEDNDAGCVLNETQTCPLATGDYGVMVCEARGSQPDWGPCQASAPAPPSFPQPSPSQTGTTPNALNGVWTRIIDTDGLTYAQGESWSIMDGEYVYTFSSCDIMLAGQSGNCQSEYEIGTVDGLDSDTLRFQVEQWTCPAEFAIYDLGYQVTSTALTLAYSNAVVVLSRGSGNAPAGGASYAFGCFEEAGFVPGELRVP